jgi:3-hydroxyisobutyrate dehydrogenase
MISGEMPVAFDVDGVRKDSGLIRDAATEAGVATELVDAVLALFDRAAEAGHGGADMAAVRHAF